ESAKICPHCKKSVDLNLIENLYDEETVELNKSISRTLWFREHSRIIFPIIFLIIGLAAGAIFMYSYSLIYFANEKSSYEKQIAELQEKVQNSASEAGKESASLKQQIDQKERIIKMLKSQRQYMSQIINFTRRLAENSTITTLDLAQRDYYQRNVRYLISQYMLENEKLTQAGFKEEEETYNLQTIPQYLEQ
ncbi:MAG: hypothetical protein JXB44_06010, partial [Calditrichaceae bacterium]|nr:hypothetical protein [Calditrichaceae bacterium]